MENPTPSLAAEIEAIKQAYDALNRNDIPAFIQIFDPEIERIEFPGSPHGGTYLGLPAVTAHISKARATWAEGTCQPQHFTITGNRIIISVFVHVRLKSETQWREGHTADVYTFRHGKAVQFHTFANEQQALEFAGVKTSPTG